MSYPRGNTQHIQGRIFEQKLKTQKHIHKIKIMPIVHSSAKEI